MMNYLTEYKKSLKNIEAEEPLDVYFFRPLAFIIVKSLYRFPITPNQYSLLALIAGIFSCYFFTLGTFAGNIWGAFFFLLFAVLDCCDGMVARLKKNGTEWGRLIDGIVDYTVNILVYFGLGYGIYHSDQKSTFSLIILAGVSKAIHSITYDHFLTEFLSYDKGNFGFSKNELEAIELKIKKAKTEKNSFYKLWALNIYYAYTKIQVSKNKSIQFDPSEYCQKNLSNLKKWSFIGPSVHIFVLIIAFLMNRPEILYFYAIVFGNAWLLWMFVAQYKTNKGLKTIQGLK